MSAVLGSSHNTFLQIFNAVRENVHGLCSWAWQHVTNAALAARDLVVANPWYTAAFVLILGIILANPIGLVGFGSGGVVHGSIAASIQSTFYGGYVPAGSIFSLLQSVGAGL